MDFDKIEKQQENKAMKVKQQHKRVFISHPFAADPSANRRKVSLLLDRLHQEHPNITFLSPLHLFSYMKSETPTQRESVMAVCYKLIDMSDEVWSFGNSEGCTLEKAYTLKVGKKYIECYTET